MIATTSDRTVSQFVRAATSIALSGGFNERAVAYSGRWRDHDLTSWLERATSAVSTADAEGMLLPGTARVLDLVRSRTLLGRLGRVRRVPFSDPTPVATGGATFAWVGESAPIPVGRLAWGPASLPRTKAAGLVILTRELLEHSSPSAENLTREEIVSGIARFMDEAFVDPARAPVEGEAPGSITYGVDPIEPTGDLLADAAAAIGAVEDAVGGEGIVLLTSHRTAFQLGAAGVLDGGALYGQVPVLASDAVGTMLVAVSAPNVMVADDGMRVDAGQHASVEMDAEPEGGARELVSLWQSNSVALRATRYLNWRLAREGAVARVDLSGG